MSPAEKRILCSLRLNWCNNNFDWLLWQGLIMKTAVALASYRPKFCCYVGSNIRVSCYIREKWPKFLVTVNGGSLPHCPPLWVNQCRVKGVFHWAWKRDWIDWNRHETNTAISVYPVPLCGKIVVKAQAVLEQRMPLSITILRIETDGRTDGQTELL